MKEFLVSIDETIDVLNNFLTKEKRKELKEYIDFKRGLIANEFKKALIEEIWNSGEYNSFEIGDKKVDKEKFIIEVQKEKYKSLPTNIGKYLGVDSFIGRDEKGKAIICHAWKNI